LKEFQMTKRSLLNLIHTSLVAILAIGITGGAASALQARDLDHKVEFYLDGKVGTELIKKGSYSISYPDADQGTLQIKVGKRIVSTGFTRQTADSPSDVDKMTYREEADGSRAIATITPRGKKYTLVLQ
jgi:hypothetical protein